MHLDEVKIMCIRNMIIYVLEKSLKAIVILNSNDFRKIDGCYNDVYAF